MFNLNPKAQIFALVWDLSAFANYWKKRRLPRAKRSRTSQSVVRKVQS
jgi:hypothetical protein